MGTIPFPDIAHDTAVNSQQGQNAFANMVNIRGAQQQQQAVAQEMEIKRRQLADQDALTKTIAQYDPAKNTFADIPRMVTQNGGSGTAGLQAQQGLISAHSNYLKMTDEQFAQEQKKADLLQGVHDEVSQAPAEQKQQVYSQSLQKLASAGVDVSKEPPVYPGDDVFAQHLPAIRLHSALLAEAEKDRELTSQETEAGAKAQTAKYKEVNGALYDVSGQQPKIVTPGGVDPAQWTGLVDQVVPPTKDNLGLNQRTKSAVQFYLAQGNLKAAQDAVTEAGKQVGAVEKDVAEQTNPAIQAAKLHLATAEKAAEQAITDGDPKAAAQLLINGTVAPSQLVSSRKPAFAQQAFTAAAQMQPGWSATKADADYKVAGSAQNVAFFGSAKSLTDKGGTLDQLADAAKDIPGNQIPVFNTIADAIKASTGSGPVAKYASILLGVADDYSKVMGGGQGSDTSRTQALSLVPAKASPEARAAAIEGIRGAVGSQINSRIGNNPVLQKMYGGNAPAGNGRGNAGTTAPAPGSAAELKQKLGLP